MKHLLKLWKWFDGKKTTIGSILYVTATGIVAFFPTLLPISQVEVIKMIGVLLAGGGLFHKGVKSISVYTNRSK